MLCPACEAVSPLDAIYVRTPYDNTAKALIHGFKFEHRRDYARTVARAMTDTLPAHAVIVAVPTATVRVRERGYDHAALLAEEMAALLDRRHYKLLERVGSKRQVGSTRTERLEQQAEAFRPLRPYLLEHADIILIDDVLTTGGTLIAAADALKRGGAASITATVFAQAR
jgi:ComF family protein